MIETVPIELYLYMNDMKAVKFCMVYTENSLILNCSQNVQGSIHIQYCQRVNLNMHSKQENGSKTLG